MKVETATRLMDGASPPTTRREFLLTAAAAAAAGAIVRRLPPLRAAESGAREAIPPHRGIPLSGVHLYTDRPSYRGGDTLTAFVSASVPCRLQVVRLGPNVDGPEGDEVLHEQEIARPGMQSVHPGSYVHVARRLPAEPHSALTIECWVRLWNLHEPQGIVTQINDGEGVGLIVFPDGTAAFFTGECEDPTETPHRSAVRLTLPGASTFSPYVIPPASWHHLAAVFDGKRKMLWLDGRLVGEWEWNRAVEPADCPLRIGAFGRGGEAAGLLDADVAMPAIYSRAFGEIEVRTRHAERALVIPRQDESLLGCWSLNEERGAGVGDSSGHARDGRIINHGTWMIGGPSFLPAVARYRRDYAPDKDATRGHGLRLASDDLFDCRWRPVLTFTLPAGSRAGLYALRGRFEFEGDERMTHASFVVRRRRDAVRAPVVLLFNTNTWKAYSAASFGPAWSGVTAQVGTKGHRPRADDPCAAYNFYRFHRAGQPAYHLGWRIPWPAASPYALYFSPEIGFSHLARADRFAQQWLESEGFDYDVLSDLDLHRDGNALRGAKVLLIAGHSEYWTREAMQRVREFLDRSGNVVCLSGNTMYWRVTQSDDDAVIECRKADAWGAQLPEYMRGECWHAHDRRRGGVPRDCGDPAWQTLGVEFAAAKKLSSDGAGALEVTDGSHPFFHTPVEVGVGNGDRFGFDRRQPSRHPVGHESDVLVSTLMEYTRRLPPMAGLPTNLVDPPGIRRLAVGRFGDGDPRPRVRDYGHRVLKSQLLRPDDSICDVMHWRREGGGQVFAVPSISAAWTLAACPQWSRLLKNVLHNFGVPGR